MKPPIKLTFYFLLAGLVLLVSCKKDKIDESNHINRPPVANAGSDINIQISSCYSNRTAELDGSRSSDPDNSLLNFLWRKISGPSCIVADSNSQKARVLQLLPGQYAFQLTVTDEGGAYSKGLSAQDTVLINVTGLTTPPSYDLAETFNCNFSFSNNVEYCQEDFDFFSNSYVYFCYYYDFTTMGGSFDLPGLGHMNLSGYEYADTAVGGNYHYTNLGLSCNSCIPSRYLEGTCSINFKRFWEQGGGLFNGTFKMENGSAKNNCDPHVFDNADLLTIAGTMDTTAHRVNLTITGKVYF
jgi:hypothetical protein